jgi:PAS domain S-box-containing protein
MMQQGEKPVRDREKENGEHLCWEMIDSVNSIVMRLDTGLRVTFINDFALEFFGFRREDILGKSIMGTIVPPKSDTGRDLVAMVRNIIREPERFVNNENWVNWTNRAVRDREGRVVEILSVGNDVTRRKKAEEALKKQLKMTETLLDAIPVPVFYKDANGIYTGCNRVFAAFLGKPKSEIIGKNVYEVAPPDLADVYHHADEELIHHPGTQVYETSVVYADGTRHDVIFSKATYLNEDGTVGGIIGTILDITKRKKIERELVKAREELEQRVLERTKELEQANESLRREAIEHRRDEEALKARVRFENLITSLSSRFINLSPEEIDRELYSALKKIGEFAGVDRCYIGIIYDNGKKMDIANEWAAEGIKQYPHLYYDIAVDEVYPWSAGIVKKHEVLYVPDVEDLPPEASKDKAMLQAQMIKSVVVVPMVYKKSLIGMVGFDSVRKMKAWKDEDIALLRIVGEIFTNAIERNRIEKALRESEERFRATFEQAAVGIAHVALDGHYIRVNEKFCDIVGYTCDEMTRRTYQDITYPEDQKADEALARQLLEGKKTTGSIEKRYICKGGSLVWVNMTISLMHDEEGRPKYYIAVIDDITRRKRAEEALKNAKARAELYLDLMGHDISNMNQAMMGYLEMAQELLDLKGHEELIERPLEIIKHSSRLIANVKKLEQVQAGKLPVKTINLCRMLKEVADTYAVVPGRDVKINVIPAEGCLVRASELLTDVFDNLVDNAIRHSTGPLTIDISIEPVLEDGRKYYMVSVADNGPGITDNLKKKIFRFIDVATGSPGRRGLGLYLVRTLVESYHGRVWVEDRIPGDYRKGSRFVVMLPAAD